MGHLCHHQPPAATPQRSLRKAGDAAALPGSPLLLLFVLLASSMSACKGAPMPSQALESDEDLQLLKEIDDACSAYLSTDSQPRVSQTEVSSTLEELCFLVMGFLQKPQFLFHYSKTHDSGNSDIMEELEGPRVIQSRGYFFYRPRNGKRSVDFR
ncbi:neuromedin-U isoform X7 [Corvus cornix cornix]|uniref:neuromedin-U isoform X7 n=1 Tax=Corvus cornix cornix TaxID=932674 RepID=UPI0009015CD5|nr:neuromedin-U isoform X7 [Corvus cornix cornix]XP_048161129.1 neuromedin-U isoform X7 [Corvus hawaiiensis]